MSLTRRKGKRKRTINGTEIEPNSFPWLVELRTTSDKAEEQAHCAGALIDNLHVLTAGHCANAAEQDNVDLLSVRLGVHRQQEYYNGSFLNDNSAYLHHEVGVVQRGVRAFVRANHSEILWDYAIILLDRPVTFTHRISPVCIPQSDEWLSVTADNMTDNRVFIAGAWGLQMARIANSTNPSESYIPDGPHTHTPMMYASRRVWAYKDIHEYGTKHQIATQALNYSTTVDESHNDGWFPSTNAGDSGSPLNDLKNERWEVAAILKGGSTVHDKRIKGNDSTYKIFESVVFHKEWMKRTVKELEDKYDASTPTDCTDPLLRPIIYRSPNAGLSSVNKPQKNYTIGVTEEECLAACRENREPNSVTYRPCMSAEHDTVKQYCYIFSVLPGYQETEGDGLDKAKMDRGKSFLEPMLNTVFFEKDCVSETVKDAALCSDGSIEKRIRREGYEMLQPKYPNISIAECLDKCVEYNNNTMLTHNDQCNHVSHEHLQRIAWFGEGGVAVPTGNKPRKVTDNPLCVLMRSPKSMFEARGKTSDKFYDPINDPWRVGRWDSYLMTECHSTTTRCSKPQIGGDNSEKVVYHDISSGSWQFDTSFPEGTRIRVYCSLGFKISNVIGNESFCGADGMWTIDLASTTCVPEQ